MSQDIVTAGRKPRAWGRWVALAIVLLAGPLAVAGVLAYLRAGGGLVPSAAGMVGAPVRVAEAGTDRVYLMTSQQRIYKARRRSPTPRSLLVDVWAFEAGDAKPVWRTRLVDERDGVNIGRRILGAQGGVLWLADGKGLLALDLADGTKAYDTAAVEAANPMLKGLIPTEERFYRFDRGGVAFTAADGRPWRLTGDGAKAAAGGAEPAQAATGVVAPARVAGGNGTAAFWQRGVAMGGRWLGLLHEREANRMLAGNQIGGAPPQDSPRMRLWSARIVRAQAFLGDRGRYADLAPLPESPEFLQPSLLAADASILPAFQTQVVVASRPDSVFVLHQDRLGEDARLRLSRVAGPAGKVLWTADLPAQALEAVMPGERSIVMVANRDEEPVWRPRRATWMERVDQLIAVDLETGKVGVYGFRSLPGKPGEIPPSSTPAP